MGEGGGLKSIVLPFYSIILIIIIIIIILIIIIIIIIIINVLTLR